VTTSEGLTQVGAEHGVPAACRAARGAWRHWAQLDAQERAWVMGRAARILAAEATPIAEAIRTGSGRSATEVWSAEIIPTLDALRWLARRGPRALGSQGLGRSWLQWYFRAERHRLHWEPYGVVGIVTPGNSLLFLAVPQVAAALMAGNAVIWKPAPAGTAVAFHTTRIFARAGLPPSLLQVVAGGAETARAVVGEGVDKLFFTGGASAGIALYRLQAERGRPAVLELSGRHVAVVLADADLGLAASGIAWGKLANQGRNCVSTQLVLVERAVYADFIARARAALALAPAGDSRVPVPGSESACRMDELVIDALARGARLVEHAASGAILIADVAPGMRVVEDEIQGLALAVAVVESQAEAMAWINAGGGRLSASVWTGNLARGEALARRLEAGQVWINEELAPVAQPEVTLAGRGASGFGATRGLAGLMEMVQPKVISRLPARVRRHHYFPGAPGVENMFRATIGLGFAVGPAKRLRAAGALGRSLVSLIRSARGAA
jgi:acyl-CoA reductase-like NAD-dependent aldehyde dehydrogenase